MSELSQGEGQQSRGLSRARKKLIAGALAGGTFVAGGVALAIYAATSSGESARIPTTLEQEVADAYTSARLANAQATGRIVEAGDGFRREVVTLTIDAPRNPAAEHSPGPTYFYDDEPTGVTVVPQESGEESHAGLVDDISWIDEQQGTAERAVNLEGLNGLGGHEVDNIYVGAYGIEGDDVIQSYRYVGTLVIDGNGQRITSVTVTRNPHIPPVQIVRTEDSGVIPASLPPT